MPSDAPHRSGQLYAPGHCRGSLRRLLPGLLCGVLGGQAMLSAADVDRYQGTRMSMACLYSVEAYGPRRLDLQAAAEAALDEVDRIDRLMSHYKAESPLSAINREAASHPVRPPRELFDFLVESLRYSRLSQGAFDITVGPLMKAWGFFRGDGGLPSPGDLAAARRVVGARHVRVDPAAGTLAFDATGVELDLGGIAKGYAVDRAVAILRARGITAALVSAGGSTVYGLGAPPEREAWTIDVQDPLDARRSATTVRLRDRALSIAGRSEKWFEANGVRYSHIMDPRTGAPVQGMLTVAVLSDSGTAGDALDDALFVLGPAASRPLLNAVPGTAALYFLPRGAHGWHLVRAESE
ncbi:MAG: FAD:protein FMN transferase [Vicinamibacterales bacterium]